MGSPSPANGIAVTSVSVGARTLVELLASVDPPTKPRYLALADQLEQLIRDGRIVPDALLPGARTLATRIGTSRATVDAGYRQLVERGVLAQEHGRGTRVLAAASPITGPREAQLAQTLPAATIIGADRDRAAGHIDLTGAYWVDASDLDQDVFDRAAADSARLRTSHGYAPRGLDIARQAVARHLSIQGLATRPDEVMITSGAQQAISLIAQAVLGPRSLAIVEDPTYTGALESFRSQHASVSSVPSGPLGIELTELQARIRNQRPQVLYVMPSGHNPTGAIMPPAARHRLAELLAPHPITVIDDRTLADTTFGEVAADPPLATISPAGSRAEIVTVGSLSKSMWAGLRFGWIRATARTIDRLTRLRAAVDLGSPALEQLIATRLLDDAPTIHAQRVLRIGAHAAFVQQHLHRRLPAWTWVPPQVGLNLWIDLGDVPADTMVRAAFRRKVGLAPGSITSVDGAATHRLRLPYGHPPDVLSEAIDRLAAAWNEASTPPRSRPRRQGSDQPPTR